MLSLVSCVSARGRGVDLMGLVVLVDTENAIFDQTSLVLAAPNKFRDDGYFKRDLMLQYLSHGCRGINLQ